MANLIDREQLQAMSQGLEEEFAVLLSQFESQTQQRLKEAEPSQAFFHELKGAAGSLGLAAFAQQTAEYERTSKEGGAPAAEWGEQLSELLAQSYQEARKSLAERPAG